MYRGVYLVEIMEDLLTIMQEEISVCAPDNAVQQQSVVGPLRLHYPERVTTFETITSHLYLITFRGAVLELRCA
jgi:hypothetical protein